MEIKRESMAQLLDRANAFTWILRARQQVRAPVLSVFCYHSVGDPGPDYRFDADTIDVTPEQFREHLGILRRHCTVIGINEVCQLIDGGGLPPNPVLITFDDGYRSCFDTALPILQEFGMPATFFIATRYVSERRLYWWDTINYLVKRSPRTRITLEYPRPLELELGPWNEPRLDARKVAVQRLLRLVKDEYALELEPFIAGLAAAAEMDWNPEIETALADQLIMSWDDIRAMRRAGMDIESHTRSHRVLQTLSTARLADELAGSREDIRREIGEAPRTVAYPVGYSIRHIPAIRAAVEQAGYKLGFTNATGANYLWHAVDPLDIHRITMSRDTSTSMFRGQLAVPPLAFSRKSM